ncbi:MAG: hypothetical protein M0C28_23280 [Candidatus Moduliflexus flocculans]|nr:hypothetical protein [Candidatus Moduliflexus flocculans]
MARRELRPPRHGPRRTTTRAWPSRTDDEDEAYFLTASYASTIDGGADADHADARPGAGRRPPRHLDRSDERRPHDRRARPGPVDLASTAAARGSSQRLTNAQMYHVTVDSAIPYNVLGNKQDEPTLPRAQQQPARRAASSRARCGTPVGGGESGWATPDPIDPEHRLVERARAPAWSAASSCASRRRGASSATSRCGPTSRTGPAEAAEVPLRVGRAAAHLAARPQHRLHRQPARAPHARTAASRGRSSAPT